jgi:hypothetical protein
MFMFWLLHKIECDGCPSINSDFGCHRDGDAACCHGSRHVQDGTDRMMGLNAGIVACVHVNLP